MLTLSIIHNIYTTSIDFTLEFIQTDVDATINMEMSLGFQVPEVDYVCLLLKNLYGLKQATKTWFENLWDTLIDDDKGAYGFTKSKIVPCIFYKEGVILISWVGDWLIFGKNQEMADNVIKDVHKKFPLTGEWSVYQCARFSASPKLSHERAVKRIVQYLNGTSNKVQILIPNPQEGRAKWNIDEDLTGGY